MTKEIIKIRIFDNKVLIILTDTNLIGNREVIELAKMDYLELHNEFANFQKGINQEIQSLYYIDSIMDVKFYNRNIKIKF